jgi:hypothetical protein
VGFIAEGKVVSPRFSISVLAVHARASVRRSRRTKSAEHAIAPEPDGFVCLFLWYSHNAAVQGNNHFRPTGIATIRKLLRR